MASGGMCGADCGDVVDQRPDGRSDARGLVLWRQIHRRVVDSGRAAIQMGAVAANTRAGFDIGLGHDTTGEDMCGCGREVTNGHTCSGADTNRNAS